VFPWKKDGWTHLYSVSAAGGPPALLTPGDFDVEYVSLASDHRKVLFNSNQGDVDRRHLWSVSAAGGKPVSLTSGNGIEWSPVATGDGKTVAYFRSDAKRPPHAFNQYLAGRGYIVLSVNYRSVGIAVLMDIRQELRRLNSLLACPNFQRIPRDLGRIAANTTKKKRKP
jgi:dipeptidyl aminopeptidase/acylaminoacyl peptidase